MKQGDSKLFFFWFVISSIAASRKEAPGLGSPVTVKIDKEDVACARVRVHVLT